MNNNNNYLFNVSFIFSNGMECPPQGSYGIQPEMGLNIEEKSPVRQMIFIAQKPNKFSPKFLTGIFVNDKTKNLKVFGVTEASNEQKTYVNLLEGEEIVAAKLSFSRVGTPSEI